MSPPRSMGFRVRTWEVFIFVGFEEEFELVGDSEEAGWMWKKEGILVENFRAVAASRGAAEFPFLCEL